MPETTSLLDTLNELLPEILKATGETFADDGHLPVGGHRRRWRLGSAGLPTSRGQSLERFRSFNLVANGLINVVRSFPSSSCW